MIDVATSITVLLVDEDPDVLDLTKTFLERSDEAFSIELEESPRAALDRVEAESIDCVVSDFRMPELTGVDLHDELVAAGRDVGFVLFTAASPDELDRPLAETDVDGFVRKGTGTDHYDRLAETIRETVAP